MADRVNAAVNDVKAAGAQPVLDDAATQAGFHQLPPGDDAVLARGKLADEPVDAAIWLQHIFRVELSTEEILALKGAPNSPC